MAHNYYIIMIKCYIVIFFYPQIVKNLLIHTFINFCYAYLMIYLMNK